MKINTIQQNLINIYNTIKDLKFDDAVKALNGFNVGFSLFDFDYADLTGTVFENEDGSLRLGDNFVIWAKNGTPIGEINLTITTEQLKEMCNEEN